MANKRHEHDRACRCDQADANCVALAVRRLSRTRVQELAEEIWAASTGTLVPLGPVQDPRGSQPGASAQAAYRRHRHQERKAWREGLWQRAAMTAGAAVGAGVLIGLSMGVWLGYGMALLAAVLVWWRLRFHPSASTRLWRRQAAAQRRTAGMLRSLEQDGDLVLHDVALPGWPASLEHLVVGLTGVWAIESLGGGWLPRRRTAGATRCSGGAAAGQLHWKATAIADALAGTGILVRPLLCIHSGMGAGADRLIDGIPATSLRQLPAVVRRGSSLRPTQVEQARARALEVLRPAA
jgi:uncharacterized membrane protein YfcA